MEILGVEVEDLEDGIVVLETIVLAKVLDAEGGVGYISRYTPDLTTIEAIGMLRVEADWQTSQLCQDSEGD